MTMVVPRAVLVGDLPCVSAALTRQEADVPKSPAEGISRWVSAADRIDFQE